MTQEQNKKTPRQFQCRDYLWEIFEQMSAELECSTDYLINEAMRQYARARNYGARSATGSSPGSAPRPSLGAAAGAQAPEIPSIPPIGAPAPIPSLGDAPKPPPPRAGNPSTLPPPPVRPPPKPPSQIPPPPALPSLGMAAKPGAIPPPSLGQAAAPSAPRPHVGASAASVGAPSLGGGALVGAPSLGRASSPPPLPAAPVAPPAAGPQPMPHLAVLFNGQKVPVQKEEFIIGRGSKSADLAIKDGNISRRHAAIVFQSGAFYMKDLGSTNGVEFQGKRVDQKKIEEGDIFQICDYELRFTYR